MKPTACLSFAPRLKFTRKFRKLPLTTKDINKGFYKGTRTGSMGRHTKFGGYIIEWDKVRTYVVPVGLDAFKVRVPSWPAHT
jgi:large subunit ribosomal protein L41